jgi:predicted RNA-binding Zn ribbon-like protein
MFESCRTLEPSKDWAQIPVGQKPLESISSTQSSRGSGTESAAPISINSNAPSAASGLGRQKARAMGMCPNSTCNWLFFCNGLRLLCST